MKTYQDSLDGHIIMDAGGFMRSMGIEGMLQTEFLLKGLSWLNYSVMNLAVRDLINGGEFIHEMQQKYKSIDFISGNTFYKDTEKLLTKPYVIKTVKLDGSVKSVKLGIIGLTDSKTKMVSNKVSDQMLESRPAINYARQYIKELKGKADIIILLYHGRFKNCEEILTQAPGIDIAVIGGEYYRVNNYRNPRVVAVSSQTLGKQAGLLSLKINGLKKIVDSAKKTVPLTEEIKDTKKYLELIDDYQSELEKTRAQVAKELEEKNKSQN